MIGNIGNILRTGLASLALAAAAAAQVHQVVFELALDDPRNSLEVDTCVAASAKRVIVGSNQRFTLLDLESTNPRGQEIAAVWAQDEQGAISSFPEEYLFKNTDSEVPWRDPRVEYDPIHGRFWITILDVNHGATTGRRFHVAVSRDDAPDTFDPYDATTGTGDWYVYTGRDGQAAEAHGDAFHLAHPTLIDPDLQFNGVPDHQVVTIDDDHLWMVSEDEPFPFGEPRGSMVSIPLAHGAGLSMLDGDRPSEADLGIVHFDGLDPEDPTTLHYNVQEPFDQFAAAQFSINVAEQDPLQPAGFRDAIRLGATRWVGGALVHQWEDLPIDVASDHYFTSASQGAGTPKEGWNISSFAPRFDSGVLFKDGAEWRILAGHSVGVAAAGPTLTDVTEFRWYLIDPDLDNFPGTNWSPQIVEDPQSGDQIIGRAPTGGIADPHTYQGAIAVNGQDAAYITFTRSGSSSLNGWPSLVRARLTADYSAVQFEDAAASEPGPKAWLADGSSLKPVLGGAYADMEPAPDGCNLWAVGTLVGDPGDHDAPVAHNERAIWVTEIVPNCLSNAEMNGDGTTDAADLALFLDCYATEEPQADMNGDSTVDTIDYAIYTDEYGKR